MGSPQLPFSPAQQTASGMWQGCLLLSPVPTVCLPSRFLGGSPVQSRVCPERVCSEKPGSTSWREEPSTAVPHGHFICYVTFKSGKPHHRNHVTSVYSIKIRKYTNLANFHHPRRGPFSWDLPPVSIHKRTHALSQVTSGSYLGEQS